MASAQEEKESGLSAFTIAVKTQLAKKFFEPWYDANPYEGMDYLAGLIPMDWYDIKFDLNFGTMEKKDVTPAPPNNPTLPPLGMGASSYSTFGVFLDLSSSHAASTCSRGLR